MGSGRAIGSTNHKPKVPELGPRIESIIKATDGGTRSVAMLLKVHPETVRSWVRGQREPCASQLDTLAHIGDVSVDWLVAGSAAEADERMRRVDVFRALDEWMLARARQILPQKDYQALRGDEP